MNPSESTPAKRQKMNLATSPAASPVSIGAGANNAMVLYKPDVVTDNASPASMEELVRATPITLSIGPEREQTTVQTVLFRGISQPLYRLMQSAAVDHDALNQLNETLRPDDKGAFLHLISLAYSIVLKPENFVASPVDASNLALVKREKDDQLNQLTRLKCQQCKKSSIYITIECESSQPCSSKIGLDKFFAIQLQHSHGAVSKQSGLKSKNVHAVLEAKDKITGVPYSLIHFAKVFHLARKYDVHALKVNSLKAFERRLKKYAERETESNEELLEVLRYLAENVQHDPDVEYDDADNQTTAIINTSTLLRSLMRYVVANITVLLDDEEFQEIVAEHGNIGLELMRILRESISVSQGSQFD